MHKKFLLIFGFFCFLYNFSVIVDIEEISKSTNESEISLVNIAERSKLIEESVKPAYELVSEFTPDVMHIYNLTDNGLVDPFYKYIYVHFFKNNHIFFILNANADGIRVYDVHGKQYDLSQGWYQTIKEIENYHEKCMKLNLSQNNIKQNSKHLISKGIILSSNENIFDYSNSNDKKYIAATFLNGKIKVWKKIG